MSIFLFLITFINLKIIFGQYENLLINAKPYGIFLDNPNDPYFHDICLNLEIIPKDVTLEYRRKYYFYHKNKNSIEFQRPIRNNTNECFFENNSFNSVFGSISVIIIIMSMIQLFLIIRILLSDKDKVFGNTPFNKLTKMKKKNKKIFNDTNKENKNINNINDPKNPYTKFTSEEKKGTGENEINVNDNEDTNVNLVHESQLPIFEKENILQQNQLIKENNVIDKEESQLESSTGQKINANIRKEIQENQEKKNQNNLDDVYTVKEKSTDNYTFGFNFGTKYHINDTNVNNIKTNNENKEEINENKEEKKGEKMKRIKEIYEEINPTKKINKENNINKKTNSRDNMNSDVIAFSIPEPDEKIYVREEYFYFKYLLARIEDKRTITQIYLDLLEQNQIIIKFFTVPFNIYEDRKLQCLYYLTKINVYFLINSLLIKSSVINDIYDGKNNIISDLFRSLKATIITYFICFFLYKLTNIKKNLIRRRYKLINLKISNKILNIEIIGLTKNLCYKFLRHKIKTLVTLIFLIVSYSYYVSFSFCKVYYHSQLLLLKCIIFCIIYSQMFPFMLCWIPAYIRKKSLDLKSAKIYDLTKYAEILFIP